jgi:phosphoglycolate phosphatase
MGNLILFDFDYTLADSSAGIIESVNYALQEMGFDKAGPKEISRLIGLTLDDTFIRLAGQSQEARLKDFKAHFKIRADQVMNELTVLYDSVGETFQSLRADTHRIGIVSTKVRHRIEGFLQRERIADLVDIIIGGDDVHNAKPDPEGVFLAAARLNVPLGQCLLIGDSLIDAQTAWNAGIQFIASLTGATTKKEFRSYPVQHFIQKMKELPPLVSPRKGRGPEFGHAGKKIHRQKAGFN